MAAVSIRSIAKAFGRTTVLAGVDLEIGDGELFFLLGGSGSGKTTLLRIVAGLLDPDAGTVAIGGADVTGLPAERRAVGLVFQNYALWPHLDVAGNVAFGLVERRVPVAERRERVARALALVELAGFEGRRVDELSGGQQQRVALARALVVEPRVLLLDEPLSNLDARLREGMRQAIRRVCKAAGVTAIYVTHDQHEALGMADRIALLDGGRVAQVGTPQDLYRRPVDARTASFVGTVNLLSGRVVAADRVDCALGPLAVAVPAGLVPGSACTVGIRPEHLRLVPGDLVTVREPSFAGSVCQWQAELGGILLHLQESPAVDRPSGSRWGVAVDAGVAMVFPA